MTIKGLTLHQPWASLVAAGAKRIETRSWQTGYRGLIAIHSSIKTPDPSVWRDNPEFVVAINKTMDGRPLHLQTGMILAVAELEACRDTNNGWNSWIGNLSHEEQVFGDYSPDRYGWMLNRIVALPTPIPYRGSQRLWAIDTATAKLLIEVWSERAPQ